MALKALAYYQGGDWLTYRWSVAHAFDTLDRIRHLTHAPTSPPAPALPSLRGTALFQDDDLQDERLADLFAGIVDLCDDLAGEIDIVLADLAPQPTNIVTQRWSGFEMRLHISSIRQQALQEHQATEPSTAAMDSIAARAARMRDLLKIIDQ